MSSVVKVEALTTAAGPPDSYRFRSGQIFNLPKNEADALLKAGAVRLVGPAPTKKKAPVVKKDDPVEPVNPIAGPTDDPDNKKAEG